MTPPVTPKTHSLTISVMVMLLAIIFFDIMGGLIKWLGEIYPVPQLAVYRNLFAFIPAIVILFSNTEWRRQGRPWILKRWCLGLCRGLFVAIAQYCFYLAIGNLAFATACTLIFAGPLFITAISVPMLKKTVGPWRWLAVFVGFIGVVLILRPDSHGINGYLFLPLVAALGYALSNVTAQLFENDESTAIINIYAQIGALAGSSLLLASTSEPVAVQSLQHWLLIITMGCTGGLAVFLVVWAYRRAEPSQLAPFEYVGIPSSLYIGWAFFNEAPIQQLFPGVFFIIAAGLLIVWRERSTKIKPINR